LMTTGLGRKRADSWRVTSVMMELWSRTCSIMYRGKKQL
jgi:hypothetical protein